MHTNTKENCPHNMIENNMCPDTCRDCGKVLVEPVQREEWEKDILSKFFVYRIRSTGGADHVGAKNDLIASIKELLSHAKQGERERIRIELRKKVVLTKELGQAVSITDVDELCLLSTTSDKEDER